MWTKSLKSGKTVKVMEEENLVTENSDSRDHLSQFIDKNISGDDLEPPETHIIGHVPRVEVGDEFQYRMELDYFGIHRPPQSGAMKDDNNKLFATSIVASGGYDDELDNSDVLTYTGQGRNVKKGKKCEEPKDQQLVKGNLALANNKLKKNLVRVIRGNKKTASESSADSKNYVYDGLYRVEDFWQETGSHGKRVFKFKLRRIRGQPEQSWKVVKKSEKSKFREGFWNVDIS